MNTDTDTLRDRHEKAQAAVVAVAGSVASMGTRVDSETIARLRDVIEEERRAFNALVNALCNPTK